MGSIFSLASVEAQPSPRHLAHADRDAQALRSDWGRIGQDFQTVMERTKKQRNKK